MKRFRIIYVCAILFLTSFTFTNTTYAAKQTFKDVPRHHFAYDAIQWAYDFDIINGYSDGTFRPNQPVTEQQFAHILINYFDLEPTNNKLTKYTKKELASDTNYNTLAAYQVPLNGYFDNSIREQPVKRGVVAQAITHVADGKANLNQSIGFLVDHNISSGQYPKYEFTNLEKFFGTTNNLTRAQVVALFFNLQSKAYFYISEVAENSYINENKITINKRANNARNAVDHSLRKGKDWSSVPDKNQGKTWNGEYSYHYIFGPSDSDSKGRFLTISNTTKNSFFVVYNVYDGLASGSVEGTATIISDSKARMSKTSDGDSCIIEFQKQDTSIKTTEFNCKNSRDTSTNFNGTLKRSTN